MDEFAGDGFVLLVGPGPRMAGIPALLSALGDQLAGDAAAAVRSLEDLGELGTVPETYGRVLLDADDLPAEDLGLVRRFLASHPGFEVWLVGDTSHSHAARRLSTADGTRLVPWPLDIEQLTVFIEPFLFDDSFEEDEDLDDPSIDEDEEEDDDSPGDEDRRYPDPPPHDPEMAAIAGILSSHPSSISDDDPTAAEAPAPGESRFDPFARAVPSGGAGADLPPFYREQIADLADIVQRLGLSVGAVHDSKGAGPPRLAEVDGEVARLQQFTRTLGYMVAPPARGNQEFDVAVVLEEMLGTLASGPDAPRFLFKGGEPMIVRSDKALVFQALDALLQVAASCGREGEVVRVSAEPDEAPDGEGIVRIRVSFPAGPLGDLAPEEIVRPYALKRQLPTIGPNALAAAEGIVAGQGGVLALTSANEPGRLAWEARLPRCDTPGTRGNGRNEGQSTPGGPFG